MKKLYIKSFFLCPIIFLTIACKELDKIDYIQFKAGFAMPNIAREGENILFQPSQGTETKNDNSTRTGLANAQSYFWTFGENNFSNEKTPTYAFAKFGTYNVKLKAQMSKQQGIVSDSITKPITILPKLNAPVSAVTYSGTNRDEIILEVLPIVDGSGYWLVGRKNINEIWVNKVDNDLKSKIGFPKSVEAFSTSLVTPKGMNTTTDGGIIIVGEIQDAPQDRDGFVVKLDEDGEEKWFEVTASLKDEYYVGVFQNQAGNYTVVGTSYSGSSNDINITADIYDEQGEKINSVISINPNCKCEAESILPLGNGTDNFLIAGTTRNRIPMIMLASNNGLSGAYSLLVNGDNENFRGKGTSVLALSDGKYALAGYLDNTTNTDRTDAFVAKFENIGNVPAWRTRFRMYSDTFETLLEDANKNIIAIGNHKNPLSDNDVFLVKYDNNTGNVLQTKTFGTDTDEQIYQAIYTTQNKILTVGLQKSTQTIPPRNNAWGMQLNESWE